MRGARMQEVGSFEGKKQNMRKNKLNGGEGNFCGHIKKFVRIFKGRKMGG
jgi:hypothetical protein